MNVYSTNLHSTDLRTVNLLSGCTKIIEIHKTYKHVVAVV